MHFVDIFPIYPLLSSSR